MFFSLLMFEQRSSLKKMLCTPVVLGETPPLGHVDLLTSRELELGTPQGLDNLGLETVGGSDAHDGLSNTNSGNCSEGLAKSTTHSSLEPVSSGTGQHFVDSDDMEGMQPHANVELIFTTVLHQVLVAANTSGLQGF